MSKQIFELDTNATPCLGKKVYCGSTQCGGCLRKLKNIITAYETELKYVKYEGDTRLATKGEGLCYYCKRKGHLAKDCRVLGKHRETEHCEECGKQGHVAKYCHKKFPVPVVSDTNTNTNTNTNTEQKSAVKAVSANVMDTPVPALTPTPTPATE